MPAATVSVPLQNGDLTGLGSHGKYDQQSQLVAITSQGPRKTSQFPDVIPLGCVCRLKLDCHQVQFVDSTFVDSDIKLDDVAIESLRGVQVLVVKGVNLDSAGCECGL